MLKDLRQRLLVTGEMAEKFFPPGFCREVVELAHGLPNPEAAGVLEVYDFFLTTQDRYHAMAHRARRDLAASLIGQEVSRDPWEGDFLLENALTPFQESELRPLHRALERLDAKPTDHFESEDLRRLMDAVGDLTFAMSDSPAYPSERALKFYEFLYVGDKLHSLSYSSLIRRVSHHAQGLLKEHRSLLSTLRGEWRIA